MDESKRKNIQWKKTCDQLKDAFDAWVDLSQKAPELSADEQRWNEMKALLKDLKGKLEELSVSSPRDKEGIALDPDLPGSPDPTLEK